MEVQARVAQYVHDNGITQKHIAEKTGISKVKISQMFNGNRKMMADENMIKSEMGVVQIHGDGRVILTELEGIFTVLKAHMGLTDENIVEILARSDSSKGINVTEEEAEAVRKKNAFIAEALLEKFDKEQS